MKTEDQTPRIVSPAAAHPGFVSAMFGGSWDVALILIILCIGIPLALSDANFDAIPDAPPPPTSERLKQK